MIFYGKKGAMITWEITCHGRECHLVLAPQCSRPSSKIILLGSPTTHNQELLFNSVNCLAIDLSNFK